MVDNPFVVNSDWLEQHLENTQVVIVDCRFSLANPQLGQQKYQESHIPGAYYLDLNRDLSSPVQKHGGRHPLPNPDEFAQKLSAMGVNWGQTLVVAYDDSRFAFAARLWWLLRYLGHDRVAVLNGGFPGWLEAGYGVTNEIPAPRMGSFMPQIRNPMVVDIEAVKTRKEMPTVVLVDSRDRERYQGITEPIDPVAGHIPSAINYPWKEVTDTRGFLIPSPEQKNRWSELATNQEIIVYCGSGVTACVNLLSLELAGIGGAKLYAGSWSDWCSYL